MNSSFSDNEDFSKVKHEAAEWVLRNDRGLRPEEQDELTDWLTADPRHKEAYGLHQWGWDELDRLAGFHITHNITADEDLLAPVKKKAFWGKVLAVSLPLAACLAVFIGLSLFRGDVENHYNKENVPIVFERIQQLELADGSKIELNHGAKIETHYSEHERTVYLLNGEANFDIAKDPTRPFVVHVSGIRLRALGTVFNVRYNADIIDLIVTEGRVQLLQEDQQEQVIGQLQQQPIIESFQRAIVSFNSGELDIVVRELDSFELDKELIWRPELIDFSDEPLAVIVEEFNRRNRVQILLHDPSLHHLRLTSIFWSDNVEAFVRLLESNFHVNVERRNEYEIMLSLNIDRNEMGS